MKKKLNKETQSTQASAGTIKKIVLTGGPGVGKSSVLKSLEERGYATRYEVFTKLFAEAQKSGRFSESYLHSPEIVHELLAEQIALEEQPAQGEFLFLDRSRIDIWGFARIMGITPYPQDQKELENGAYDLVLVLDPLPEEFYDQNQIRRQDFKESLEHHHKGIANYTEFFKAQRKNPADMMVTVPFVKGGYPSLVQERVEFILSLPTFYKNIK